MQHPYGWYIIHNMNLSTPIASVVGGARGRLLEAVVRSERPRSVREWARRAEVNHSHAQALLREFEGMGLVRSVHVGGSTVVTAVPASALRLRLQGLLSVAQDIVDVARSEAQTAPTRVTVTLFGSLARSAVKAGSDADLCVIAPDDPTANDWVHSYVARLQDVSCLEVSVLRFTPAEWNAAVAAGEQIVDEIRRDGIEMTEDP